MYAISPRDSLLSDEDKKFETSSNKDSPHKADGYWLQTYSKHRQQEVCPLLTVLARRAATRVPDVLNTASATK